MDQSTQNDAFRRAQGTPQLENLVDGILGRVLGNGGSQTVFGEPVKEGTRTVIPVARVTYRFGFGAGSGPVEESDGTVPGGGGGGGMLTARPVGFIEVDEEGSIFEPVIDWSQILQTMFTFTGIGIVLLLWRVSRNDGD